MLFEGRFVLVLVIGALLIGFSGRSSALAGVGVVVGALAMVAALADWLRLSRIALEVSRTCEDKLSLGTANLVTIRVRNPSRSAVTAMIRDEYPEGLDARGNVATLRFPARSETDFSYHVTPPKRGDFEFGDIYIRLRGPLGMLTRQTRHAGKQRVAVYPNLLDMRRYQIGLRRENAVQPGQRAARLRGRGTDFESLRDYSPDDEFRSVDWKASARRGKLISRQYQEERSQNVLIVLDCGRVMGPVIDGLTRLDHAINAAMILAHVAAAKGDRVGMMAFGDQVTSFSPPRAGKSQTIDLLRLAYNLKDAEGDSDYHHAIPYLTRRWTRRSLVVFFTDLADQESSKPLISRIGGLTRKHLCMCVVMADPAVSEAAFREPGQVSEAFEAAAARQVLQARKLAVAQMVRTGAIVVDVPPGRFTPAVVDEYLKIKARAAL